MAEDLPVGRRQLRQLYFVSRHLVPNNVNGRPRCAGANLVKADLQQTEWLASSYEIIGHDPMVKNHHALENPPSERPSATSTPSSFPL